MTLRAELDESRLQAGLDAGDARFVDTGFLLLAFLVFDIKVVQLLAINQGHPHFFGLGGVDQHSLHGSEVPLSCGRTLDLNGMCDVLRMTTP